MKMELAHGTGWLLTYHFSTITCLLFLHPNLAFLAPLCLCILLNLTNILAFVNTITDWCLPHLLLLWRYHHKIIAHYYRLCSFICLISSLPLISLNFIERPNSHFSAHNIEFLRWIINAHCKRRLSWIFQLVRLPGNALFPCSLCCLKREFAYVSSWNWAMKRRFFLGRTFRCAEAFPIISAWWI